MVKQNILKKELVKLIIAVIGTFYILFLILDMSSSAEAGYLSTILKYGGIVLCCILVLLIGKDGYGRKDRIYMNSALILTCIADLNFLFLHYYSIAIGTFCFVQSVYIFRHSKEKNESYKKIAAVFLFNCIVGSLSVKFNMLFIIASLYGILLLISLYKGITIYKIKKYPKLTCHFIKFGLIFFFLCDFNIAISYILNCYPIYFMGYDVKEITAYAVWLFYLPSQLLLSLSGYSATFIKEI